ncbi:glycerophosphodiester phosphodiesterase family protein [Stackebrandtia nassauensis]|uniref:Glycerophosphoryl diester phosphodiesterase n=1 Tax=Stackebrandtia nassauensis (strain DSM 44728 / CIP 108903 / NRRL B-16338 / NBRC 102104 / LLR-40K-21) TaxID=446470 RepID=D3Q4V2_STANL|nr:glycerophosphodiester phosphodiesterase family protein [Stackebrandtia nassauensis]ADD42132.1 glycerophosphoryl diester phosphodiesterase [Stackebrandtia nassauensis DSM 44728]
MSEDSLPASKTTKPRFRKLKITGIALLLLAGFVFVNNTSLLAFPGGDAPQLLAHRGMSQTFDMSGVDSDTCTAERINEPRHDYLENTIRSMKAAFDAGADQVELDVQMTKDDQFAVFHDWELDCRTEASGKTRDLTMAQLRKLDIGYGYTADGGKTFPFRGKGVGMMPSLDEVFDEFGSQELLLHIKSDDPAEGELLAKRLSTLSDKRLRAITVYGGDKPIAALREKMPKLRVMSKALMMECLGWYEGLSWIGTVPASCRNTQLHIPESYAPWLWGWPHRFGERMASVGTRVVLVAGSGEHSEGFDSAESLRRIPEDFTGMVWTNSIEVVAPRL